MTTAPANDVPALTVNGRPLRVLHIGNIANNAYNNAKVQRRADIHADVLCYNYYHIMGSPEWEDADFDGKVSDQFYPEWNKVDLHGFVRPEWFIQGDLRSCIRYLIAKHKGQPLRAWLYRRRLEIIRGLMCRLRVGNRPELALRLTEAWMGLPARLIESTGRYLGTRLGLPWLTRTRGRLMLTLAILPGYHAVAACVAVLLLAAAVPAAALHLFLKQWHRLHASLYRVLGLPLPPRSHPAYLRRCEELAGEWARLFPDREPLKVAEMGIYFERWREFSLLLPHYDIVQAYATDPIWPLLCGCPRYVAFEHGTLRDLPRGRSIDDQLTSLAYRKSANAFVTNGDCLEPARQLGIPTITPSLHGIDDSKIGPTTQLREELLRIHGVDRLYLCPLRHDWAIKGTDKYIRALPEIIRRTGPGLRLFMMTWGHQVEESKQLAQTLGVAPYVVWQDPVPHRVLVRWYGAVDCVFDQIAFPCFGGTAPESMGCGTPVIMSYDPKATAWIIPEPAPILPAWGVEDVVRHVAELTGPEYRERVSRRSREWFARNHTSARILADHVRAYREILGSRAELPRAA